MPRGRIARAGAPSGALAIVAIAAAMAIVWWMSRPSGDLPRLEATAWLDPAAAPVESLRLLPGIGATLAARIDRARREGLAIGRADDLLRVPGIGPRRVETLRPLLQTPEPTSSFDAPRPSHNASAASAPDSAP